MFFNQAKDIEYWAAFQGYLLYSLVVIPEDKLPFDSGYLKSQRFTSALWAEETIRTHFAASMFMRKLCYTTMAEWESWRHIFSMSFMDS